MILPKNIPLNGSRSSILKQIAYLSRLTNKTFSPKSMQIRDKIVDQNGKSPTNEDFQAKSENV